MSAFARLWAWEQPDLNPTLKCVLMGLADFHTDNQGCFPSLKSIAEKVNISVDTVTRSIDQLVEKGLVKKIKRKKENGANTSNFYELQLSELKPPFPQNADTPSRKMRNELENLEPKDSDTSYQTNSSLSFTDLLEEEPPDERKIFWDESIGSLMAMGLADPTARSWLGKCLKMAANDYQRVAEVIQAAVDIGTMDPISYMAAALGGKKAKKKREIDDAFAELRAASDKRKQQWAEEGRYDDTGGSGGDDHVVLQPDELPKPESVRKNGRKGVRKVSAGNAPQIVRPNLWNSDTRKIPADNRGTGGGSAETLEAHK